MKIDAYIKYDSVASEYYLEADIDYDSEPAKLCYLNKYSPVKVQIEIKEETK